MQLREIDISDSERIAELNQVLGYQPTPSLVLNQLSAILSESNHFGFVAEVDNRIVGYIHGFISLRLTTAPFAEIGGLVVDPSYRSRGIGKKLVEHFELQLPYIDKVRVRCNVKRNDAHAFYLALNYQEKKEQKVFEGTVHSN